MAENYTPHSLPILGTADLIRSPTGDNIRKQLNAISTAADTAITNEGIRAEGAAKDYADSKDSTNRTAWAAADTTTLNSAKSYTDSKDSTNRSAWASADTTTLNSAKSYTDSKDSTSRTDWGAADTATLNSAKSYSDGKDAVLDGRLTSAESRLTTRDNSLIFYGNGYVNPPIAFSPDGNTRGLWHLDGSLADSSTYGRILTQYQANAGSYTNTNTSKFGTRALNGGIYNNLAADTFLSSTGADGGALTTGTIECWVYSAPYATNNKVALSHQNWYWLGINAAGIPTARYGATTGEVSLTGTTVVTSATYSAAAWHHLALVIEGGAGRLYVDGKLEASSTTVASAGTQAGVGFAVGGLTTTRSYDWSLSAGYIDEVRLSDVARYSVTSSYKPARPAGLRGGAVEYTGPVVPTDWQPGDRWFKTGAA